MGSSDMFNPKVSVIIPVYNGQRFINETIELIRKQTFAFFEVVFVDDGSTDSSVSGLRKAAEEDGRFVVLQQVHSGAGAARNKGLAAAKGEYVIFSDCDDLYDPDMLEKLYRAAVSNQADIVACNYIGINEKGAEFRQTGIFSNWLPGGISVFSYRDCPDNIMRITSPVVWNKMYRRAFLIERGLRFDEIPTCNDLSFVAVSQAAAERITYLTDSLIRYRFPRLNNPKNPDDICAAVTSARRQLEALPHRDILRNATDRFAIENYIGALKKYIKDFASPEAAKFYQNVHEIFNGPDYAGLDPNSLHNSDLFREFLTVQKHDYQTMKLLVGRRIVVSMTSYPRRIGTVANALDSIYAQTRKADEVVLWLAEEQFPGKEAGLPENLRKLIAEKRLTVRWCDDLKGHKKYFYALQEYTDDVVVTVDDDLLYPKDMLAALYKSYLLHPNAVSTMRSHLILLSEEGEILPYRAWLRETDSCMHTPSMQLMASGGAGDLYPPRLLRPETFDHEAVKESCLWADNLWIKFMELISDVPVVLAYNREPLKYVEDTQEETLFHINGNQNQYDIQMKAVIDWLEHRYEPGILQKKLTDSNLGVTFTRLDEVTRHINIERERSSRKVRMLENQLKQLQMEKTQAAADAEEARKRIAANTEENRELVSRMQKEQEESCRKIRMQLQRAEEGKPILRQLKELGRILREQRGQGIQPVLAVKFLVYYLAWIPASLLWAMMYVLKNGLGYTLRRLFRHK